MRVMVDGRQWLAHRLAWLYVHGEWPDQIDHVNGIKTDNRISNLRNVCARVNMENVRGPKANNRSSGVLGVTWWERGKKWKAQINMRGRNRHLGYTDTIEDAQRLYLDAKRRLHEGCTI